MAKLKVITFLILLCGVSFLLGLNYENLTKSPLSSNVIKIHQQYHDWAVTNGAGFEPVSVSMYLQNKFAIAFKGEVNFEVSLDQSLFEKSFMDDFIKLVGRENLLTEQADNPNAKFRAIKNYILRGHKLEQGKKHEEITPPSDENYSTIVSEKVYLKPNETDKVDLEVMIPPALKGYALSVRIID